MMACRAEYGEWVTSGLPYGRGVAGMLKAYLDDSGSVNDQPCAVIGGFIASAQTWKKIERKWEAEEIKRGVGHWHTSKMRQPGMPCHGWSAARWYQLRAEMTKIIMRPSVHLVGAAMLTSTWLKCSNAFEAEMKKREPNFVKPSALGFLVHHAMQQIIRVANRWGRGEAIGAYIEQPATGMQGELERILSGYLVIPPWSRRLKSRNIGDRDTFPGLRIADFGANGMFRYSSDSIVGGKPISPTDPLSAAILNGSLSSFAKYYSDDAMKELTAMIARGEAVGDKIP